MRILEKMENQLNTEFRQLAPAAFQTRFGIEIEQTWNFVEGRLVSRRKDGEDFTPEQYEWLSAYEIGYSDAMGLVQKARAAQ